MKKLSKWIVYTVTLIFLCIIIIAFIPIKSSLVFFNPKTDEILAYVPLSDEQAFKMKYTHSIHLSDVVESYRVTSDGEIQQYELEYEDFAIGMPSDASEGETFETIDGKYYLKNMNRVFPHIDLRIARVRANHTLIFENNEYPLLKTFEKGTRVRIKIVKLKLPQLLKGVNIIESK